MDGKKALGRGLGALLSEEEILEAGSPGYFLCPLEKLRPNPAQPRKTLDESELKGLAESIKEKGVLQPLVVRRSDEGEGTYDIIAGERRYRAALMVGLASIPVVIKDVSPEEVLELALIENIQRMDLTPMEEAMAYRRLLEEHGITQKDLSRRIGKDRSTIANTLRLLKLPQEIQEDLNSGSITMGHARALLMLEGVPEAMLELCRRIKSEGLTVRQAEAMARALLQDDPANGSKTSRAATAQASPSTGPGPHPADDPDVRRLSDELTFGLGFRVKVVPQKKGGKIEIYYNDLDDLDRLIDLLEKNAHGV